MKTVTVFLGLFTLSGIALKLFVHAELPWWLVLMPTWYPLTIAAAMWLISRILMEMERNDDYEGF